MIVRGILAFEVGEIELEHLNVVPFDVIEHRLFHERSHPFARKAGGAVPKRGRIFLAAFHVRVDHIEVEPKPEFHALFFNAFDDCADAVRKILLFEIKIRLIFFKPERIHEVVFDPERIALVQFRHAGDRIERHFFV